MSNGLNEVLEFVISFMIGEKVEKDIIEGKKPIAKLDHTPTYEELNAAIDRIAQLQDKLVIKKR